MKGIFTFNQHRAHSLLKRLAFITLLSIIVLCFTLYPINSNAPNELNGVSDSVNPVIVDPEFLTLNNGDGSWEELVEVYNFGNIYRSIHKICFSDTAAFLVADDDGMIIADITDPHLPTIIGKIGKYDDGSMGCLDVCYSDGCVYVQNVSFRIAFMEKM